MFTVEDLIRLREAVKKAERGTKGEIVPMIVPASALYREARHHAGLAASLLTLALFLTLDMRWQFWWVGRHAGAWMLLGTVAAYVLGYWFGRTPAGIRLFVSGSRMDMKVRRRAESAFYEHGLHRTREGTGVLIMVSLLERRVQVLADQGINQRVPVGTWTHVVQGMLAGIREGRPVDAFCEAIARCGEILAEHFPSREGDNPDELPNDMIKGR
jgi:putative membrane protein